MANRLIGTLDRTFGSRRTACRIRAHSNVAPRSTRSSRTLRAGSVEGTDVEPEVLVRTALDTTDTAVISRNTDNKGPVGSS